MDPKITKIIMWFLHGGGVIAPPKIAITTMVILLAATITEIVIVAIQSSYAFCQTRKCQRDRTSHLVSILVWRARYLIAGWLLRWSYTKTSAKWKIVYN